MLSIDTIELDSIYDLGATSIVSSSTTIIILIPDYANERRIIAELNELGLEFEDWYEDRGDLGRFICIILSYADQP
jgi:hypothetical protein